MCACICVKERERERENVCVRESGLESKLRMVFIVLGTHCLLFRDIEGTNSCSNPFFHFATIIWSQSYETNFILKNKIVVNYLMVASVNVGYNKNTIILRVS